MNHSPAGGQVGGARPDRPRKERSLRWRILRLSAVILTATMAVGVVGFVVALSALLDGTARQATEDQTDGLLAQIEQGASVVQTVQDAPARGSLLQVLDDDGTVLARSDSEAEHPLTDARPDLGESRTLRLSGLPDDEDEPHVVVATGVRDDDGRYTLVVAQPVDTEAVGETAGLLALAAAALIVVMLGLIAVMVTRALAPVEEIRRDVARIQHSRGAERVTVPATGDEIARLAQTMNQMLDRLQSSDAAVRRFVSDASHELRSPLATVRAGLETAGPDNPPDLELLTAETGRMQRLVEDLLTLARADDQGLSLARVDVDLDDLVDGEVRRLRAVGRHAVTARIGAARVLGDELRLTQVLRNLTDNADRHARSAVRLTVGVQGAEAVVDVDNDGPVIDVDRRAHVFDRFARLQDARDRDSGGSGLGLAIVQTLVTVHGGRVEVGEAPDGWCRFTVRLPVAP